MISCRSARRRSRSIERGGSGQETRGTHRTDYERPGYSAALCERFARSTREVITQRHASRPALPLLLFVKLAEGRKSGPTVNDIAADTISPSARHPTVVRRAENQACCAAARATRRADPLPPADRGGREAPCRSPLGAGGGTRAPNAPPRPGTSHASLNTVSGLYEARTASAQRLELASRAATVPPPCPSRPRFRSVTLRRQGRRTPRGGRASPASPGHEPDALRAETRSADRVFQRQLHPLLQVAHRRALGAVGRSLDEQQEEIALRRRGPSGGRPLRCGSSTQRRSGAGTPRCAWLA